MLTLMPADVALAQEAMQRAIREIVWIETELIQRNLGSTGATYGMSRMDDDAVIEAFIERAGNGALDMLRVISPTKWYPRYLTEFNDAIKDSPLIQYVPNQQVRADLLALRMEAA